MDESEMKEVENSINYNNLTSPSQLEDVTSDPDATNFFGSMDMRSPGGRGRSVKEFEEQLSTLRKENFNLKLRIYFLEERMGTNFNMDKENAVEKNIELMIQMETLRKELAEKQDLLCQAVKAMELEEEEQKKKLEQKDEEIFRFQQMFSDKDVGKRRNATEVTSELFVEAFDFQNCNSESIKELEQKIENLERQVQEEQQRSHQLENVVEISECVNIRCNELEEEIKRKDLNINLLVHELAEAKKKLSTTNVRVDSLGDDLANVYDQLELKNTQLHEKDQQLSECWSKIEDLKKMFDERKGLYELEQKKVEKCKSSIMQRNDKIMELESCIETQRAKIRHLETMLESSLKEVKSKSDELEMIKTPLRREKASLTDADSFSARNALEVTDFPTKTGSTLTSSKVSVHSSFQSPKSPAKERILSILEGGEAFRHKDSDNKLQMFARLEQELSESQDCITKLKGNNFKACKIIESMIATRKEHFQEISELKDKLQKREEHINELQLNITSIKNQNADSGVHKTKSLHEKISEMNLTATLNPIADNEESMVEDQTTAQLAEQYKLLTIELEEQVQVLTQTINEKEAQFHQLQYDHEHVLNELRMKDSRVVDLEFELLSLNQESKKEDSLTEKSDEGTEKSVGFWVKEIEEKDREIERLESELCKRTCDLQGIVNNELWEKNKEIEKLVSRHGHAIESKDGEILKLQKELTCKELQLKTLKDEITEIGLASLQKTDNIMGMCDESKTLQEQLHVVVEERKYLSEQVVELNLKLKDSHEVRQLKVEYKDLQEELEKSEKLRQETNDICGVLAKRLEELSLFLNSLLKKKVVLGLLGNKQTWRLKQVIDQSLDLSHTLNMTMSLNPDQSLLELTNLTTLLNSTCTEAVSMTEFFPAEEDSVLSIIPSEVTLSYQSHLNRPTKSKIYLREEQADIIGILREQVENLKREIEIRDVELANKSTDLASSAERALENDQELMQTLINLQSKKIQAGKVKSPASAEKSPLNTSTTLKNEAVVNQSESESWSEPDRNVSMARMGLPEATLKLISKRGRFTNLSTESTEDEMPSRSSIRRSDTRQIILTLHEQVNELEDKLKEKENQLLAAQVAYYEADNKLKQVQVKTKECEKSFEDFLMKIDETEVKLSLVESLKDEAEMKVVQLREMVTSLEEHKLSMEEKMCVKDKEMQNKINQLESEKMQAVDAANLAEKNSEKAREDAKQVKIELLNLKKEVLNMNNQCQQEIVNKLKEAEDRYVVKIQTIERSTEEQIKKIKEAANQLKVIYDRDYIKRTELEKRTLEVEMMAKELETLKQIVNLANDKMQAMIDNEEELKKTIERAHKEHQAQVKMLRRELDSATLQYSEVILEKTKIMNEKASVEQQLERFEKAEVELSKQVREVRQAFDDAKQNYQRQTLHTEAQKSSLEVKISELESRNAELCNRLIKIQVGDRLSSSLPASPTKIYDSFTGKMIQVQPDNYKRQNSNSAPYACAGENHPSLLALDAERQYENSSPDLGIDSDHGRFSSLEVNIDKTSRPLLRTLELTETMNTLLVGDHCQEIACTDQHCCNRVRQISNENINLRKRLLRTRRALEETVNQLTLANQRKKQVERSICKQIHQTSQVLRKAKAGLDSGSDSDLLKK